MFGLLGKKPEAEKKPKRTRDLSQFGLFEAPTDLGGDLDDADDNDSDLEAELAAITAGAARPRAAPKKPVIPAADLDRMVADSLRDDHDDDDDDDIDENDPDLLSELHGITGTTDEELLLPEPIEPKPAEKAPADNIVDLLTGRLELYRLAEANAKAAGDAGKARRIGRGLKTLADLLKKAKAGQAIDPDDIPPEVTTKSSGTPVAPQTAPAAMPTRAAPEPPVTQLKPAVEPQPEPAVEPQPEPNADALRVLNARKREFQVAALAAKHAGDLATAKQCVQVLKEFDRIIAKAAEGALIDLSAMPTVPRPSATATAASAAAPAPPSPRKEEAEHQTDAPAETEPVSAPEPEQTAPTTVAEALTQRLAKYQSIETKAKEDGDSSKARRYGRIIKQYQDAIKLHRAGRPVPFDELPTPPGFGPIPGVAPPAPVVVNSEPPAAPLPPTPATSQADDAPACVAPTVPARKPSPAAAAAAPQPLPPGRLSGNHSSTTLMQQTIQTLSARAAEFRRAAVEAKQAGNLAQAKEYLRQFKQLEQLLEVARGGMPVDLSTVPLGPAQRATLEDTFDIVSVADCAVDESGLADISVRLEHQLVQQLTMCRQTRDHHRAMGDVAGTNRFENLAVSVQKDCDLVKFARAQCLPVPKFHYERKRFDIVRCNTDLADTELEINVCRGIGYSVPNPKDVDTYVKLEVPLPSAEAPFKARTQLVRDTDSPQYDEKFVVEIAPKNRACQRVFKRHAVKLEVFSKGGFLRSDVLIGTVTVKLQPLETVCELHESFDLMDGRKTNGGKLEVRIRTRNPILTTQIQHTEEKWLVIDS